MAYQNVDRCKFYVDNASYLKHLGHNPLKGGDGILSVDPELEKLYHVNPAEMAKFTSANTQNLGINYTPVLGLKANFVMILNHNTQTKNGEFVLRDSENIEIAHTDIVNSTTVEDGYSIMELDEHEDELKIEINSTGFSDIDWSVGALLVGNSYTTPFAPDLKLKLSYDYDGISTLKTKGGATLSNALYTQPPKWGLRGAWENGNDADGNPIQCYRSGRRKWDLSFSFLSDTDVFPVNPHTSMNAETATDYTDTDIVGNVFTENIITGTDFFSEVYNKCISSHIPFVFQPDYNNNNDFAVCRFDQKSLQLNQTGHNLYSMKIRIVESW
mgnify:CR=1 FL=1|tara:strand:- start:156 stop:1139 length:984 start_codon:yes stop_codon:yes gene_type:complete